MDGKVRYASDSCLAESSAGGKDQLLGNVALSYGDCSTTLSGDSGGLRTGKNAQNTIVGQ